MVAGGVITGLFLLMAVFAPLVAPYGEAQYRGLPQLGRPSADHWFGTTNLRYDVFSRVVFGTRLAFQVVILSTAVAMVIGVPLGLVAGYSGRWLDRVLLLLMDAMYAFPSLLLAIVAAFALARYVGQGVPAAAISISVIYVPQYFRVVRNHTLAVREETFVEAARAMGAKRRTVVGRYVFFNVVQSVPVIFTVNAADAILTLAALGFLGYGVPIPAAEWGYDISRAIGDVANGFWWTSFFPGMFILGLVTGLTLLGEGINDIVNPLLRRRGVGVGAVVPGAVVVERAVTVTAAPVDEVSADAEDFEAAPAAAVTVDAPAVGAVGAGAPVGAPVGAPAPAGGAGVALSVRDLRVTYASARGPVVAVDGVSLDVRRGESVGLVGVCGCGKSTLGRGIVGILPGGATASGRVVVDGVELSTLPAAERRRARGEKVALIFQEPMTRLDPLQRVEDHFVETIQAHRPKVSRREADAMAATALAAMRIPLTRARNYPHEFSGGMRQRIMIALGLVLGPAVVVADEPTTSLDVIVEAQILEILDDLRRNSDMGLVLITHNLGIVAQTCDRLAVMYAGHIVEEGSVGPVFSTPRHPYTQGLLASVISLDTERLSSIPGSPPDLLDPPPGCRFAPRCPFAMVACREQVPALAPMDDGSRVACHLYPGADPRHPGRRWVPVGRRDDIHGPWLEGTLQ
ncbi:MAG: peptide/nickel transport system ATP-binding protein [Actinomycetota bacterium]|jgi:peptide/nickel transport system permease protein|nr:peptide/nickel transport system ATP-binding protein [Actinomycetota bacterium]